jgi:hypothetical protein
VNVHRGGKKVLIAKIASRDALDKGTLGMCNPVIPELVLKGYLHVLDMSLIWTTLVASDATASSHIGCPRTLPGHGPRANASFG